MLANTKNSTLAYVVAGKGGARGGATQSGVAESCLNRFGTQLSLTNYLAHVVSRECVPKGNRFGTIAIGIQSLAPSRPKQSPVLGNGGSA